MGRNGSTSDNLGFFSVLQESDSEDDEDVVPEKTPSENAKTPSKAPPKGPSRTSRREEVQHPKPKFKPFAFKKSYMKEFLPSYRKYKPVSLSINEPSKNPKMLIKEDADFLKSEACSGYTTFESQRKAQGIIKLATDTSKTDELIFYLNEAPENDNTMKMKVLNRNGVPTSLIAMLLRYGLAPKIEECRTKFFKLQQTAFAAQNNLSMDWDEDSDDDGSSGDFIDRYISSVRESYNVDSSMLHEVVTAIACAAIANMRIIQNVAHFPGIKQTQRLEDYFDAIPWARIFDKSIKPKDIINRIHELLEKPLLTPYKDSVAIVVFSPWDESEQFAIVEVVDKHPAWVPYGENFCWKNPRDFFNRFFILPRDVIKDWRVREQTAEGWDVIDVKLGINSGLAPPKNWTLDRCYKRGICPFKNWTEKLLIITAESMKNGEQRFGREVQLNLISERLRTHHRGMRTSFINEDVMTCKIRYCEPFCHWCYSTLHRVDTCPNIKCSVCGEKTHTAGRCPRRTKHSKGLSHTVSAFRKQAKSKGISTN